MKRNTFKVVEVILSDTCKWVSVSETECKDAKKKKYKFNKLHFECLTK